VKGEPKKAIASLGKEALLHFFEEMLLIRHFEMRAESAYQHGHVGDFFMLIRVRKRSKWLQWLP